MKLALIALFLLAWIPQGVLVMGESEQVAGYVDAELARSIKARAEVEEMTVSEFVAAACREKLERDGLEDAATRYRVEERMMTLVDEAADRAADRIVEGVQNGDSGSIEWGEG